VRTRATEIANGREALHQQSKRPVMIVSFSGIDGAGKSTQIVELEAWLRQLGLRTQLLTFWDDVVILSKFREFASHKAFRGDRGVGSPQNPLHRRDKNVTAWPVTLTRFGLYLADALHLRWKVREARRSDADIVILDRYIYDELANLPLTRWSAIRFTRLILKLAPKPDIAYLIDAAPVAAQARKPEYPLEFVRRNRDAYITLAHLSGAMTVVRPDSIAAMKTRIQNEMLQALALKAVAGEARHLSASAPNRANISPGELIEP
jgi:thymidylate kinase